MKSSMLLLSSISFLLVTHVTTAQVVASKSLVKSFNVIGKDILTVDLGDKVTTQEWTNDFVRVQINITLLNGTETTLKSLIESGRYQIKSVITDSAVKISAPGLRRPANVNGTEINENISFILYVPASLTVEILSPVSLDSTAKATNIPDSQ
jgi:hypothetical protein